MKSNLCVSLMIAALFSVNARADEKKQFWIEAGVMTSAWAADTISTHQAFESNRTRVEIGGIGNGTRNTPKIMASWGAIDFSAAILAFEWKRHVRNRYLHPLWHLPMLIRTEEHTQAAIGNWRLR